MELKKSAFLSFFDPLATLQHSVFTLNNTDFFVFWKKNTFSEDLEGMTSVALMAAMALIVARRLDVPSCKTWNQGSSQTQIMGHPKLRLWRSYGQFTHPLHPQTVKNKLPGLKSEVNAEMP